MPLQTRGVECDEAKPATVPVTKSILDVILKPIAVLEGFAT